MLRFGIMLLISLFFPFLLSAQDAKPEETKPMDLSKVEKIQDIPKEKTAIRKLLPLHTVAFFDYIFKPDTEIKNIPHTRFELNEYRVAIEPNFEISDNLYLGIGVHYNAYNFAFDYNYLDFTTQADETEHRTLHSLSFPITLTFISEEWLISGQIATSINSDFRGLNRHDAQVNGGIIVGYLFHPTFLLQVGVFATNDFGDTSVVPAGGFVWKPSSYLGISMLIPFSANIDIYVSENTFTLFGYYELDGNQFRFRYRENGQVLEEDGQFTFYNFGIGAKYFIAEGISIKLVLGMPADGRYEFSGISTEVKDGRMDGNFFFQVGLTIDENIQKLFESTPQS